MKSSRKHFSGSVQLSSFIISITSSFVIYILFHFVFDGALLNSYQSIPIYLFFAVYPLSVFTIRNPINPASIYGALLILKIFDYIIKLEQGNSSLRYIVGIDDFNTEYYRLIAVSITIYWAITILFSFYLKRSSSIKKTPFKGFQNTIENQKLKKLTLLFLITSIASFTFLLVEMGGINGMVAAMVRRSQHYQGLGFVRALVQTSSIAAVLLLYRKKTFYSLAVIVLSFFMTAMLGGRGSAFLGVIVPYLFVWSHFKKRLSIPTLLTWALVGIIFLVGMQYFKFGGKSISLDFDAILLSMGRGAADILPSMLYALDTNMIDYQLGRTFLNIPLSFIPRVVWQNKPTGLGEDALLGRLFLGENYWALPPGEYGVAYLNFSLIGLIALPILVGYISAILYNSYKKLIESDKISLYTITYPFIFLNIFSFFTIYSFMGILFKIILIVFFYSLSTIKIKKRNY